MTYNPLHTHLSIFDLDNTLFLSKLGGKKREDYEQRLRAWLRELVGRGHVVAVASFNKEAESVLHTMGIRELFGNNVLTDTALSKRSMVEKLMGSYPAIPKANVTFYDDDFDSVLEVRAIGVNGINVAPMTGIRAVFAPP